jgi:PAS domain S-box-containing protein
LVAREGVPTRTAETVLVRREGDDIVFFSPLRHVPAGSPNLRFPLATAPLPARAALEGRETFLESTDYRDVPVLTASRHIPLTGWGLVRKIDREEALAEFYRSARTEGAAAGLLLLASAGLLIAHRRHVMARILRQEEEKFRNLLESAPDAMVIVDRESRIALVNAQMEKMFGYDRQDLVGRSIDLLVPEWARAKHHEGCQQFFAEPAAHQMGAGMEMQGLRKDGIEFPLEVRLSPIETVEGVVVSCGIRDVTERKRAEEELHRLNRALRTISECNQALVRAQEEPKLLQEVCRILVEDGGYRLAWVGYAEQDEAKSVRPVASFGFQDGYLEVAKITWADNQYGRGPTGLAIRTGEPRIARNIRDDPEFAPWREEAVRRGYASSIALPLNVEGRRLGALMLYSPTVDSFDVADARRAAAGRGGVAGE